MPQEPINVFLKCTWEMKSSFNHISTVETMKRGANCEFKDNVNLDGINYSNKLAITLEIFCQLN